MENVDYCWKEELRNLYENHKYLISFLIIAIGLIISFTLEAYTNVIYIFIRQVAIFISAVVAVEFLYGWLLRDRTNKIFLDDMEVIFKKSLQEYNIQSKYPLIHENGRLSISDKVAFMKDTKKEYIEIALAMRSFTGYFTQRSDNEFKKEVELLLQKGVNFKLYLLDPDSEIAKNYSDIRGEHDLIDKIENSKIELLKIKEEFKGKGFRGKFEIYYYLNIPYFALTIIDKDFKFGKALVSNYLPLERRAEMPVIEITKENNNEIMGKYIECLNIITKDSKQIE